MKNPLKPYLKYAGGKSKLVPDIEKYWELHRQALALSVPKEQCSTPETNYPDALFVDLFCGSAAVPLGIRPERCLLNDSNPHVINLHNHVKRGLTLPDLLSTEENFYSHRILFNALISQGEFEGSLNAGLLYYLNRTCYNGLMRFNQKGEFNVPYGKYKKVNYLTDFTPWQQAFQNWQFSCKDFREVPIPEHSFCYFDPPYDAGFTGYDGNDFTWKDQESVAYHAANLVINSSSSVLCSNLATDRIVELYTGLGFEIEYLNVARSISCVGSDRKKVKEILAWKSGF